MLKCILHVHQSYKERKALILTQMPLKNTKDDFWSLVEKHDVHTIVMLNTVNEAEVSPCMSQLKI